MEIIDDHGNLFGRVNVIDALVVLIVVAVAVAGGALVLGGDEPEPEPEPATTSINATLDLGTQPSFIVDAIQTGDSYSPTGLSTLRITDVYTTPDGGETRVLVAVQLTGKQAGASVQYDGGPPRLGRTLEIVTASYEIEGQIRTLGGSTSLQRTTTTVTLRDSVSTDEAAALTAGDRITVAGRTAATIRNVTLQPSDTPGTQIAFLTVDLGTIVRDGIPRFAGNPVRTGQRLQLATADYTIDGTVTRVGQGPTTNTDTIVVRDVIDAESASQTAPGSTIRLGSETVLRVTDRVLQPTDDPTRHIAFLTLNVTTVSQSGTPRFAGQSLRRGGQLTVRSDTPQIDGEIQQLEGTPTVDTETIVLRSRLPADQARQLAPGDSVQLAGQTVATIQNVSVYATNDPTERVVFLAVELTAIEQAGTLQFGGTPLRRGQTLSLNTGTYRVTGEIDRIGGGLARSQTSIVLRDTVDADTAAELDVGDRIRVDGRTTAIIQNLSVYGTADPGRKRVALGLRLQTIGYGERPQFGTTTVTEGSNLTLQTEFDRLTGEIDRVGTTQQRGTSATRTVTLRLSEVRSDFAQAIQPGMVERSGRTVLARIQNVSREPSIVLIRGNNGSLGVYDHPTLRDVTITAELQVRETTNGIRFKGEIIQQGETVVLDLGTVTVRATVVQVRSDG